MKKIKVLLMITVLSTMLCACASRKEPQLTEADVASMSYEELESLMEERETEEGQGSGETEETQASETVEPIDETFECLPEMLEADLDDCLIQIDKTILRDDHTMTLDEVITALQNSGVEYRFIIRAESVGTERVNYGPDVTVKGTEKIHIDVYKEHDEYFTILALNTSEEEVRAGDAAVIFEDIEVEHENLYRNMYYCRGLRADGGELTHEAVKEIFAELGCNIYEDRTWSTDRRIDEYISVTYGITTPTLEMVNTNGETVGYAYSYYISNTDKCCIEIGMYTEVIDY